MHVADIKSIIPNIASIRRDVTVNINGEGYDIPLDRADRLMHDNRVLYSNKEWLDAFYHDITGRPFSEDFSNDDFDEFGEYDGGVKFTDSYTVAFLDGGELVVDFDEEGLVQGTDIVEYSDMSNRYIGDFDKKHWNIDIEELMRHVSAKSPNVPSMEKGGAVTVDEKVNNVKVDYGYEHFDPALVWNSWTEDQRKHFIFDHVDDETNAALAHLTWATTSYEYLDKDMQEMIIHHVAEGRYEQGGYVAPLKSSEGNVIKSTDVDGYGGAKLRINIEKYTNADGENYFEVVQGHNGKMTAIVGHAYDESKINDIFDEYVSRFSSTYSGGGKVTGRRWDDFKESKHGSKIIDIIDNSKSKEAANTAIEDYLDELSEEKSHVVYYRVLNRLLKNLGEEPRKYDNKPVYEAETVVIEKAIASHGKFSKGGSTYAEGGAITGRNNSTGERFGVVIGSMRNGISDNTVILNVRKGYGSRLTEDELLFDVKNNAPLIKSITEVKNEVGGKSQMSSGGHNYFPSTMKESIEILAKKYAKAFSEKVHNAVKEFSPKGVADKMARGGAIYEVEKAGIDSPLSERMMTAKNLGELKEKIVDKYGSTDGVSVYKRSNRTGAFYRLKAFDPSSEVVVEKWKDGLYRVSVKRGSQTHTFKDTFDNPERAEKFAKNIQGTYKGIVEYANGGSIASAQWNDSFHNADTASTLGDQRFSYVPFHKLSRADQQTVKGAYTYKKFLDEHYYYPVKKDGTITDARARRILAIPHRLLNDDGFMSSLGYEKHDKTWTHKSYLANGGTVSHTYKSSKDEDGDVVFHLPVRANSLSELISRARKDKSLESFLFSELRMNEGVKTLNGAIFYAPQIQDQLVMYKDGGEVWVSYSGSNLSPKNVKQHKSHRGAKMRMNKLIQDHDSAGMMRKSEYDKFFKMANGGSTYSGNIGTGTKRKYEFVRGADDSIVISDGKETKKWLFDGTTDTPPSIDEFDSLKSILTFEELQAKSFKEAHEKASNTYSNGGQILTQDEEQDFQEWIKGDDVIETEKGIWLEQTTQYNKKFTTDELRAFFKKEYLSYSKGGEISDTDAIRQEAAEEDIEILEDSGYMAVSNTVFGTLHGGYENGVYEFNTSDFKNQYRGGRQGAINFLKGAYIVEIDPDEPTMARTQFEEEVFGFEEGGEIDSDPVFEALYNKYDAKDYWHVQEQIKTQLRNWKNALEKGDEGAKKYNEQQIRDIVAENNKVRTYHFTYLQLKEAIEQGDLDTLLSRVRYDQKFTKEAYEELTGEKLPNTNKAIREHILKRYPEKAASYSKGGEIGDEVEIELTNGTTVKGKIEKLNPLKVRTDATSTRVIPNPLVKNIKKLSDGGSTYSNGGQVNSYEVEYYDEDGNLRGTSSSTTKDLAIKKAQLKQGNKVNPNDDESYYVEQVRVIENPRGTVIYIKDDLLYPNGKNYAEGGEIERYFMQGKYADGDEYFEEFDSEQEMRDRYAQWIDEDILGELDITSVKMFGEKDSGETISINTKK